MPATTGSKSSPSSASGRLTSKERARRKARCNEVWFSDAFGNPHTNNWHHDEWFLLAEQHDRLLIEAAREHSKTQVFAITQPLVAMAADKNIRILLISDVYEKSQERCRVLKEHIGKNHRYVPWVKIARARGDEKFWIERDHYWLKEATITSTYAGGPIAGGRYDLVIADDLVSYLGNSNTPAKREKLKRWWNDEVENSIAPGGRVWVIGTHQHPDDLYEELKRRPSYHVAVYPAVDEEDTGYGHLGYADKNADVEGLDRLCLWPIAFSYEQHMAKKNNPSTHDSYLRQQQQLAVPETGLAYRKPLMDAAFARGDSVTYDPQAAQFAGLDPGYGKRAAFLAVQERVGDRVELWAEHSFTQMADEDISRVVCDHVATYGLEALFIDSEDPGLATKIRKDRDAKGLSFKVVPVPFSKYKRLSVKATRWLLESGQVAWGAQTTTVHTPGRVSVEPSIFRREISVLAIDPNDEDMPVKSDDHGPDSWLAYASKHVKYWAKATRQEAAA